MPDGKITRIDAFYPTDYGTGQLDSTVIHASGYGVDPQIPRTESIVFDIGLIIADDNGGLARSHLSFDLRRIAYTYIIQWYSQLPIVDRRNIAEIPRFLNFTIFPMTFRIFYIDVC